jgi:hypothetical protein
MGDFVFIAAFNRYAMPLRDCGMPGMTFGEAQINEIVQIQVSRHTKRDATK